MNGRVQLFHDRPIPGPYTQQAREAWLRQLLEAQTWIRAHGPEHIRSIELITLAELAEIRRIWVTDKHEFEDSLPGIYIAATGDPYPGEPFDSNRPFGADMAELLREVTGGDRMHFELVRALLDVEQQHRYQGRRAGIFDDLEQELRRGGYASEEDAVNRARRAEALRAAGEVPPDPGGEPGPAPAPSTA